MRGMLVRLTMVAPLLLSGCSATGLTTAFGDDIDAGRQQQAEAGMRDARAPDGRTPRMDASGPTVPDAGEAGSETPESHRCPASDTTYRRIDDAGVDDPDAGGAAISGVIAQRDECVPGVELCLSYGTPAGVGSQAVLTDAYGVFEFSDPFQGTFYWGSSPVTFDLTPRKFGYEFDPPIRKLEDVSARTDIEGLRFNAVKLEIPDHALGRWRVVEDHCDTGPADAGMPVDPVYCYSSDLLDETGKVFVFENGCLFGGIGCVKGISYSDTDAFCRTIFQMGMARSTPVFSQGEFDQQTGTWRMERSWSFIVFPSPSITYRKQMVLEREP